jgi:hypothetical protein
MPVRIKQKLRLTGTVTPSNLNVETTVISLDTQSNDYIVEGFISLRNMDSGDSLVVREYVIIDGTNYDKTDEITFSTVPNVKVVRVPAMTIPYNGQFKVTVTQTAGTVRSYPYVFIVQVLEEI